MPQSTLLAIARRPSAPHVQRGEDLRSVELVAVSVVLVLVGTLAYGSYVTYGGFYVDDWSDLAGYHFAHSPRYWSDVGELHATLGGRPLLPLLLPIPNVLFGLLPRPTSHWHSGSGSSPRSACTCRCGR